MYYAILIDKVSEYILLKLFKNICVLKNQYFVLEMFLNCSWFFLKIWLATLKTNMTLFISLYKAAFPSCKKYVMFFQMEEPLIHEVYFEQIGVVHAFLTYFVKPEKLLVVAG